MKKIIAIVFTMGILTGCDQSKVYTYGTRTPKAKVTQFSAFDSTIIVEFISENYNIHDSGIVSAEAEDGSKYLLTMPVKITPIK